MLARSCGKAFMFCIESITETKNTNIMDFKSDGGLMSKSHLHKKGQARYLSSSSSDKRTDNGNSQKRNSVTKNKKW